MIKRFLTYLTVIITITTNAFAKENIEFRYDGLYLDGVTMHQLEKIYHDYEYKDYIYMPEWKYPPIFAVSLPVDYDKITDAQKRNRIFLQMMVPLALKVRQDLILERDDIEQLIKEFNLKHNLSEEQIKFLEEKAVKYDIFTRLKGERRLALILKHLKEKVDIVPPSILIAAAAIETGWGLSRPAKLANSLYRELVWHTDEGLKPLDDKEDDSYRYKIFPSLYDSMSSQALKINSNVNYEQFRTRRAQIRSKDLPVLGRSIAHAMYFNSNLPNFAGILDYTLTFYELTNIDEAELAPLSLPKAKK